MHLACNQMHLACNQMHLACNRMRIQPATTCIRQAGIPAGLAANSELRELALGLQRDMIQENPNVKWDDIAELGEVKRVLKESLVIL